MKKILFLTDISASLNSEEAKKLDVCILPLSIYDEKGKSYIDNNLAFSSETILNYQEKGVKFSTSCTPPLLIEELVREKLKDYDYIISLPISSKFSSEYSHIKALANSNEFKNKLFVANTLGFGYIIEILCRELREKINNGYDNIKELIRYAEDFHNYCLSFFVCKNLKGLVQSGRAPAIIAKLFKLTKIYPIIRFDEENHFSGIVKKWDDAIDECLKQLIKNYSNELSQKDIKNITILQLGYDSDYIDILKAKISKKLKIPTSIIDVRESPKIFVHIVSRWAIGLQVVANKKKHKIKFTEKIKKIF